MYIFFLTKRLNIQTKIIVIENRLKKFIFKMYGRQVLRRMPVKESGSLSIQLLILCAKSTCIYTSSIIVKKLELLGKIDDFISL